MTVRRSIDAAALSARQSALEGVAAAEGVNDALDAMFTAARASLSNHSLTLPNDDRWREVEAVFFGAIQDANPDHDWRTQ